LHPEKITSSREAHSSTLFQGTYKSSDREIAALLKLLPILHLGFQFFLLQGPNHKVEMKGCYSSTEKSSAISEHLNTVEIKCNVVDEKILEVMKFLKAFNIRKLTTLYILI
jgi:hypothetical protein